MSNFGFTPSYFPAQKKLEAEKNKEWFIDCVKTGVSLSQWGNATTRSSNVRPTRKNKLINYNLRSDKIDPAEIERVTNPYKLDNMDFPSMYKNYPLINPAMNLLCGEERRRIFTPTVSVINSDALTHKVSLIKERFNDTAMQLISQESFDEEAAKKRIIEFDKWRKYTYKDIRERMGSQVLNYLYQVNDLKEEFSRGFEDLLIAAEEIYVIEIIGGEPILRKGNPLNFYTMRSGNSWKLEDSDIIVEDTYMPIGRVLDRYHDHLSDKQVNYIESYHSTQINGNSGLFENQLLNTFGPSSIIPENEMPYANSDVYSNYNGSFDPEGNVRVTRVVWRGMRKIKIITKYDDFGNIIKEIMPEQYKPNKELGETVKEEWITEWYEGTRIGSEEFIKLQPCDIQIRHSDNPSICNPGIVGTIFNINSNTGRSLFDEARDLQYLYNFYMYNLELLFTKYKGKIAKMPLHLIPDGWTIDKWLYYAEYLGWAVVDAFNESQKASFRGKPAGLMNETSPVIDLEMGNLIQNYIQMLEFVERRLNDLTGVTPQRKGAIDNRETLGGVERSVNQSSYVTEKWYDIHDNTRKRALRALLEAAKIAWSGQSFSKEFVLDDGTKQVIEFDYDKFKESSYGVDITSSSNDLQALSAMRQLGDRFLQSGGSLGIIADLYRTKSVTDMQRKIETYEEDLRKRQEEADTQQNQANMQIAQQANELEQARLDQEYALEIEKLDREDMNKQLDREYKINAETIKAMGMSGETDSDSNGIPDIMEQNKFALEQIKEGFNQSLKERELRLKNKELDSKESLEKDKMKLAEKKLKNDYRIAKMNKNKHDKK